MLHCLSPLCGQCLWASPSDSIRIWRALVQPVAQVLASVPATAFFPILLIGLLKIGGGLGIGSVALMLLGTQWYILFNVIAGAMSIPSDLREVGSCLQIHALAALDAADSSRHFSLPHYRNGHGLRRGMECLGVCGIFAYRKIAPSRRSASEPRFSRPRRMGVSRSCSWQPS